jgi:hypothetical protein
VHDDIVGLLGLEVRQIQRTECLDRLIERVLDVAATVGGTQILPDSPDGPQSACAIESLSLAVFAEAHRSTLTVEGRSVNLG